MPGDKSISHRVALLALLASGRCRGEGWLLGAWGDERWSLGVARREAANAESPDGERLYSGFSYLYLAQLSWVAGIRGDYAQGYALAQQLAGKHWTKTFSMVWRLGWGLALALGLVGLVIGLAGRPGHQHAGVSCHTPRPE